MTAHVRDAVDAVFRIESPRLIAGLVRLVRDVGLAEELAQDALVSALEQWPESGVPGNPGAWLMAADVFPPWLECASSITMAKVLPASVAISSSMKGNFCTVETMIFLPCSINLRKSPECSAWPTVAPTCMNCLIVF